MAIINQLENIASAVGDGVNAVSNAVTTLLALPVTMLKSVDKLTAQIGDTLNYTCLLTNINLAAITALTFTDPLPDGCEYVDGSFKLNNTAHAATYDAETRALTADLGGLAILGVATVTFQCTVTGGETE